MSSPLPDEVDVVVVGAGGAGMTAALAAAEHGLETVLLEKSAYFGGSTARSGGGVWIPGNYALREAGQADDARAVQALPRLDRRRRGAEGPPRHLRRPRPRGHGLHPRATPRSASPWVPEYADYHPEAARRARPRAQRRAGPDGRPFLGDELDRLHPQYTKAPANLIVTQADYRKISLGLRTSRGPLTMVKVLLKRLVSLLLRPEDVRDGQRPLDRAAQGPGRRRRTGPLRDRADRPGHRGRPGRSASASCATASNGGPGPPRRDPGQRRLRAQPGAAREVPAQPTSIEWTTGSEFNTGGGILAGIAAGADTDLLDDAWWGPTIPLPSGPWFCLAERNLPGSIIVNGAGQRFMNEALPYVEAVHEIYKGEATGVRHVPAWMVIDQRYRNRYLFAGLTPRQPFPGRWYKHGTVKKAATLAELAAEIDVPADALAATVDRFNGFAAHRGRRGLPPRRERLRQVLLRPHREAEPVAARHRPGAVLRREDRARRPRHQGRAGHRRAGPGAAPRRLGDRRACTPPATCRPRSWATPTPAPAPRSARR